ncbi:MAG TPA: M28 family peptidase [Methylomirabilota bacterium]|nr:M28 family peptidase [Methylomirabilota bacterium]
MIRRRAVLIAALAILFTSSIAVGHAPLAPPPAADLLATVETLTRPEMDGRRSGTAGAEFAAARLAQWLAEAGVQPGGDNGTYFQSFVLATGRKLGPASTLEIDGRSFTAASDWTPHGGSRIADARGELVFLGYGVSAPDAGWDDWTRAVRDKIVLVLDGVPSRLRAHRASRLDKVILARHHGAAALLIVSDALPSLDATAAPVDLVSGSLTVAAADTLVAPRRMADLAREVEQAAAPVHHRLAGDVRLRVDIRPDDVRASNVIGVLPGTDPARAGEAVVLGAHYDHLGENGGAVYAGADDNASGTAVVVGLARAFAAAGGAARTLVIAFFGAEEAGLVGSAHYVRHPAWPLARTVGMLNFDMVGRMQDGKLTVGGADTGDRLRRLLGDAATGVPGVTLDVRGAPYSASDHSRFYAAGTPVLFFHTGVHADYHRPSDTADKLEAEGMARVAAVGARAAQALADGDRPVFARVAPPARRARTATAGPLLGVGGDGRTPGDGVRLAHIVPGSAADRAGLRDGDVLVRVGGQPVDTFEELRSAIQARQPGDVVRLLYLRDGRDHVTSATLERSHE